jgi:hypothetical protein
MSGFSMTPHVSGVGAGIGETSDGLAVGCASGSARGGVRGGAVVADSGYVCSNAECGSCGSGI